MGAITNERIVAKSTNSFRLSPNCSTITNDPEARRIRKTEYSLLEPVDCFRLFFLNSNSTVRLRALE